MGAAVDGRAPTEERALGNRVVLGNGGGRGRTRSDGRACADQPSTLLFSQGDVRHEVAWINLTHSYLNAINGSTLAARRAGM